MHTHISIIRFIFSLGLLFKASFYVLFSSGVQQLEYNIYMKIIRNKCSILKIISKYHIMLVQFSSLCPCC